MISAIGSSFSSNEVTSTVVSAAGIEAQLARDKKELSNCVNCASAETKQGQADIQALTNKITAAEARLTEITSSDKINQPDISDSVGASESVVSANADLSITENKTSDNPSAALNSSDLSKGRIVDVFA